MDRSYRLKMEDKLNTNTLTKEYILNCIAKKVVVTADCVEGKADALFYGAKNKKIA